jgi:Uma2 family endonuclease
MATAEVPRTRVPEPAWEIARLFPGQGCWSVEDYFELTEETNHLVEYTNGRIEVLETPTTSHQAILLFLLDALRDFVNPRGLGQISFAPLKVRLSKTKYREPDVIFMLAQHGDRAGEEFSNGADLVMEIVSKTKKSRQRDLEKKRRDYARAAIPEYWIVDPHTVRISVLKWAGQQYEVHCDCGIGELATSSLLQGFAVDVAKVFGAASPCP